MIEYFAFEYFQRVCQLMTKLDLTALKEVIACIQEARNREATIYVCGNGGSAATASHFATDLAFGTRSWDRPYRCISLGDNSSIITALANDYSYEDIFKIQLKTLLRPQDVLLVITASGNSKNLISALKYAASIGAITISFTGFDGGICKDLANKNIHVPTEAGEYGPVEDIHLILNHLITKYLRINK